MVDFVDCSHAITVCDVIGIGEVFSQVLFSNDSQRWQVASKRFIFLGSVCLFDEFAELAEAFSAGVRTLVRELSLIFLHLCKRHVRFAEQTVGPYFLHVDTNDGNNVFAQLCN